MQLGWLPEQPDWRLRLRALRDGAGAVWEDAVRLSRARLDFTATAALDDSVRRRLGGQAPPGLATRPVRLAVLGASTLGHLLAGIRVGGLRRDLWITTF